MEYHEAVNFLFDLRRFQVKPGTASVRSLLAEFDDPQDDVSFVQIAGSNGKGSTARMAESVLREAGLTVGLYTSPHFEDIRERIRVDGRKIPESALAEFVAAAKPWLVERAASGEPLTFFEVMTAMAIWRFADADVDVAVLEVGMGGELDATSVVDPVASAVTNVTLEHTAVLGDTVEEIAEKKVAVAPDGRPLVTGATGDALDAIRDHEDELITVGTADAAMEPRPNVTVRYDGRVNHQESAVVVSGPSWGVEANIPLLGSYQAVNAGIACVVAEQAADEAGTTIDATTLERGLRRANWPGRFEVMERNPHVVLDGAHNPGACAELASVIEEFDFESLHLVFGAMHDKDHREMAAELPRPASVVTCRPNNARSEDPETLARVFEDEGAGDVTAGTTVSAALRTARERAGPDDCVLVAGSLFLVAEARTTWTRTVVSKRVETLSDADRLLSRANVPAEDAERTRGDAVHRVYRTTAQRRQARRLREEMLAVGGDCAVSGHRGEGEQVDVVLTGTRTQFERVRENLAYADEYGLSEFAGALDAALDGPPSRPAASDPADEPEYPWSDGTAVMGILNVTPDSFHDGGEYRDVEDALERAEAMAEAGADIIDIGGESTRPGADVVPVEEEIERIVPVIESLAETDALVSVDTRKADVARAALDAGADILNDVTGLEDPEMRFLAAERDVPVIVMHSIDAPVVPGKDVAYDDVVEDVIDELKERILLAEQAGVPRENVIVDPGLGFGKTAAEDFEMLDRIGEFESLGCPVLVGHSHKSMFELVGEEAGDNLEATIAATTIAADRGADIVRVHDVRENVAAVNVALATRDPSRFADGGE
ncbi:dihydropteroate synthase [Halopelagius longus]|uniref:Probable bifunctional folylpolyglutamate synthase/dihydropteroate synthase n=1 Tax=Halopelagius longus TaxID=1236180 RepID=A0A1H1C1K3_9EURY|nr:dihydropteroate synthase [Halopelagius longus]RDI71022.1 dihydropteroate synthase [Halopelagius longus]SDQ58019.1 dihydropteroate synthase [Halopelagius longus]